MILTDKVELKWSGKSKKHYEKLGYEFTGILTTFIVDVCDLTPQSHIEIKILCDDCKKSERLIPYREYLKQFSSKEYHCKECDKKNKFNNVIKNFKSKGYTIVSDLSEYKSVTSKVKYICEKHIDKGILEIKVCDFNSNSGCRYCGTERAATKMRSNYDVILEDFKVKGLTLLTKEYKSGNQLLDFTCETHPEKGIQKIRYRALKEGQGCKFCGRETAANKRRFSFDFVKSEFEKRGYTLLDTDYVQAKEKLSYTCNKHQDKVQQIEFRALYNQNQGCRFCGNESISGENNWNWKGGISPLSTYLRQFLTEWKKDSFKNCDYKCVISKEKSNGKFEVHHLYAVNSIISDVVKELSLPIKSKIQDYTEDELNALINNFVERNNKLLGVVIKPEIHRLYHSIYGYGNNTPEQFEEFKKRFHSGEFKNQVAV